MAMQKKDSSTRARANRASTAASLDRIVPEKDRPKLPQLFDEDGMEIAWHPSAQQFWDDYWASPMAANLYAQVDRHRLFIVVDLIHRYWNGEKGLASEIRLACAPFGTTPMERRSNEWDEPKGAADAEPKGGTTAKSAGVPQGAKTTDPRLTLVS